MATKRLPHALRTGQPPKHAEGKDGWFIDEQYIVDSNGDVICQWGSYTKKANAKLICAWSRYHLKTKK